MGLNTRLTVGSVIFVIMLLSIFGVNRAFRTLTGNPQEDRIESVEIDAFESADGEGDRTASQTNAQLSNTARTFNEDGELDLTPLQTAGTFIQRQKRIEEDPTVLGTEVSVFAVADGAAANSASTAAQPNTITTDQSPATDPTPSTSSRPTSTAPAAAPAVPALW